MLKVTDYLMKHYILRNIRSVLLFYALVFISFCFSILLLQQKCITSIKSNSK